MEQAKRKDYQMRLERYPGPDHISLSGNLVRKAELMTVNSTARTLSKYFDCRSSHLQLQNAVLQNDLLRSLRILRLIRSGPSVASGNFAAMNKGYQYSFINDWPSYSLEGEEQCLIYK